LLNSGKQENASYAAGNGEISSLEYEVKVDGNPGDAVFFPNKNHDGDSSELSDYLVYFPLARNTNKNNIAAAAQFNVDVTSPTYPSKPVDCDYADASPPPAGAPPFGQTYAGCCMLHTQVVRPSSCVEPKYEFVLYITLMAMMPSCVAHRVVRFMSLAAGCRHAGSKHTSQVRATALDSIAW
jgi:hypothetical protein